MKLGIALLAAVSLLAFEARAEILAYGTSPGSSGGTSPGGGGYSFNAKLNGDTSTLTFSTTNPQELVRITYNARCVGEDDDGSILYSTISVDNKEALPSGKSGTNVFCNGFSSHFYPILATQQSVIHIPTPGVHIVKIKMTQPFFAKTNNYGWTLSGSSTVVDR